VILCMFVDIGFYLQFVQNFFRYGGELSLVNVILATPALISMIYVEYLIYRRLFPERFW